MLFLDYFGAELARDWSDKIEELPGGNLIEQGQIRAAREGRSYWVLSDDGGEDWLPGIDMILFWETYYKLWEDHHYFGVLPHGAGTRDEKEWILDVIKIGCKAWTGSENIRIKRAGEPDVKK